MTSRTTARSSRRGGGEREADEDLLVRALVAPHLPSTLRGDLRAYLFERTQYVLGADAPADRDLLGVLREFLSGRSTCAELVAALLAARAAFGRAR